MSDASSRLQFGDFELDESNAMLTRAGEQVALPPKAFTLLCVLARQPGRLADKNALLDAVWGHRHVSESVLKSTVSQVRAALADDAGEPRYIETVARRGYRFIGRVQPQGVVPAGFVTAPSAAAAPPPPDRLARTPEVTMIGRLGALARLREGWQAAQAGQRQLYWIAGEAGIGKTTLIDRFVAEAAPALVAHGQCVEQFGAGEPYLPVLEALKSLCRQDPELVPLLRQVAPTWLLQMPWLIADADRAPLHLELAGAGQERMVRELWELLERYTQQQPLLLVTEDLHWSDHGTLRLMDHFARRRAPIRLQWVASFRLTQVIAEEHPLQALRQELQLHRLCEELLLDPFSETEVAAYVATRVPGTAVSETFVQQLHAHTDGLPLFVANVFDNLLANDAADRSELLEASAGHALPVPDNLSGAIEKQLARLAPDVRAILEAASVCGMEFRATTVAHVLEQSPQSVATRCDDLVRRQYWLRDTDVVDLPDGTVETRYAFRHALYKHVFYQRIAAAQRIALHRRAARSLTASGAGGVSVTPIELASHHELGREYMPALAHYVEATKNALGHFAPREAIDITTHGLTLLPKCPESPERLELELGLLAHRGIACAQLLGVSSPESVQAFNRVREICDLLPPSPSRALLLNGLGWGFYTRGEYTDAETMSMRVHALAEQHDDNTLRIYAATLIGVTLATTGRHRPACDWLRRGIALCEQLGDKLERPLFLLDPEVAMRSNLAPPLMALGLPDQARAEMAKAMARSAQIGQPIARMLALWCCCLVAIRLQRPDEVATHATELGALVETAGLRQGLGPSLWMRGWAEIRTGEIHVGYSRILEGYRRHEDLGMYGGCTEVLGYAAEAMILAERWDEAQRHLEHALALVERLGERGMTPELTLLQARVAAGRGDKVEARALQQRALADAQHAQALGGELKALIAMVESGGAKKRADVAALRTAYARFTEGFDVYPAARARELLGLAT